MLGKDTVLYIAISTYVLTGIAFVLSEDNLQLEYAVTYIKMWLPNFIILYPTFYLIAGFLRIHRRLESRRSLAYARMFSTERCSRFIGGTILLVALLPFQITFTSIKTTLSRHGFPYDLVQADIDRVLHFGIDPWRILYAAANSEWLLRAVEFIYGVVWFLAWSGAVYWFAVSPAAENSRMRFFLCFMLVWFVIGNCLAGAFLSAGPAFYGHVTGDHGRFADLIEMVSRTNDHMASARFYQNYLWAAHVSGQTIPGSGISAFPSVHVGLTLIIALFINEYSRALGIAAFAYTGVILFSSVYLAWHYAIDGYASIAVVLLIYLAMKYLPETLERLRRRIRPPVAAKTQPGVGS